jgi:hypothetical protein
VVSVQGKQQGSDERACPDVQTFEERFLMKLHKIAAAALLALAAGASSAAGITLSDGGSNFLGVTDNGTSNTKEGITGRTITDEIGIGETLVMNLGSSYTIKSFQVGVLYDGPEFGDVNEKAQVSFFDGANLLGSFVLTATGATSAGWTGAGTVSNLSPAAQSGAGHWKVDGLGIANVSRIAFTALTGSCGAAGGSCNNQSDFMVTNVTAVPEPGTYAMLLAGLGALGFMAKRRKLKA